MGIENIKEEKREVQRIEFGLAGAQARKWVAEVMPDQSIRIVEAVSYTHLTLPTTPYV